MGDVEEQEPEAEAVVGPSGEATAHSSGNTPLCLSFTLLSIYTYIFPFKHIITHLNLIFFFWSISHADESESETEVRAGTKEEEDLGILRSWIEVGGIPALDEGEAQRLLQEVGSFFPSTTNLASCFCFFS